MMEIKMVRDIKEFSDEQWQFLNVLYALGGPVPVQVAGVLAPLLPGPLFELIDRGRAAGWLLQDENNRFSLIETLPENMKQILTKGISRRSLDDMVQKIYSEKLEEKLDPKEMVALLNKAGRMREAGEYEIRLAHEAFENHDYEMTRVYLQAAAENLYPICLDQDVDSLFLSTVLELSNILFSLGYGFGDIEKYLVKANDVSKEMGNQRTHALINLHLGRLYYFTNRRDEALIALSMGFEEIREIGDNDILTQSAMFLGLYYFIKGFHREAIEHFEKAEKAFETSKYGELNHSIAPFLTG
jgi:tetratricopeptide (TPR) repeat protein